MPLLSPDLDMRRQRPLLGHPHREGDTSIAYILVHLLPNAMSHVVQNTKVDSGTISRK